MSNYYRVVTFQSKEVVDILLRDELYLADINKAREGSVCEEDIYACDGNTPIWVFQHPAFCFDKVGDKQFCNMLETFRCEMSIGTLNGLYMIELHLNYQPPVGKAHNSSSLACVIPSIKLNDVASIYELKQTEFYFYDITPYRLYSDDCLFDAAHSLNKEIYENDKLPKLNLIKFRNEIEYYSYEKVKYVYVLGIVGNKRLDLITDEIIAMLPKQELGLVELYEEVTKIVNAGPEKVTDYQKLVRDCNSKYNKVKSLATALYDKWTNLGSTDKDLIGIYNAMYAASLSVYELECLTNKRLVMSTQGYSLEDCSHDITVDLSSDTKPDNCKRNANALGVLSAYKSKFNISDDAWPMELERLQTLCNGTTDIYMIANFVETIYF